MTEEGKGVCVCARVCVHTLEREQERERASVSARERAPASSVARRLLAPRGQLLLRVAQVRLQLAVPAPLMSMLGFHRPPPLGSVGLGRGSGVRASLLPCATRVEA